MEQLLSKCEAIILTQNDGWAEEVSSILKLYSVHHKRVKSIDEVLFTDKLCNLIFYDVTSGVADSAVEIEKIKTKFPDVIIIALSKRGHADLNIQYTKIGVNEFIREPILESILISRMLNLVNSYLNAKKALASKSLYQTFLRIMNHDVANPVSVMTHHLERLIEFAKSDHTNKEWKEEVTTRVGKTINATEHLRDIIDNSRDVEGLISGKLTVESKPTKVANIFKDCEEIFDTKLEKKNISLNYLWNCDKNTEILGDRKQIALHVFSNGLSNAIKFSEKNSEIIIEVSKLRSGDYIEISAINVGSSIDEKAIQNLFSEYAATTSANSEGIKGTGFGLPIALKIAKLHGGSVNIRNLPDNKVQFSCIFRLAK